MCCIIQKQKRVGRIRENTKFRIHQINQTPDKCIKQLDKIKVIKRQIHNYRIYLAFTVIFFYLRKNHSV